jgi:glycosyltransferase involved in cell wall biosynthesis
MSLVSTLLSVGTITGAVGALVAWGGMLSNLRLYTRTVRGDRPAARTAVPMVSVCIPARNEEANIEACVRSVLANVDVAVEVLVYDDQSTDATPAILARLVAEDARVRVVPTQPLPQGWNGKQWGCERMGQAARGQWVLFTDADVRFERDCVARTLARAESLGADLLSTAPRQVTGSWAEHAVIPLISFVLLSYLPMARMRATTSPAASGACGQFILARRDAWLASGGHAAFRASMHDGIKMPRAFRRAGFRTDLFDGTDLVQCRMYRGFGQVWRGFAKNAYEGLGSPVLLLFVTLLHGCAVLLPWLTLALRLAGVAMAPWVPWVAALTIVAGFAQRIVLARRFAHAWASVALHPVGILMLTVIQWHSLWLHLTGRRAWKGRTAGAPAS